MYLYEAATGKLLQSLPNTPAVHWSFAFTPDGKVMSGVEGGNTIQIWGAPDGKEHQVLKPQDHVVEIALSPDGKLLATSDTRQSLRLWDTATGQELRSARAEGNHYHLAFSPDGKTLSSGTNYGVVTLWETATLRKQATLTPPKGRSQSYSGRYYGQVFSPDGTLLAVGEEDAVVLWDVATRKEVRLLPNQRPQWLAFSPDGKTLASSGRNVLCLWDVTTGQPLHSRTGHEFYLTEIAASPDGKIVVTAALFDAAVQLWEAATGKPLHALPGHESIVRSVCFSPDGKWVVSCGAQGSLQLWETATGQAARRFQVEDLQGESQKFLEVYSFRFSPDGKQLAAINRRSKSGNPAIRYQMNVWDVDTGKLLARRPLRDETISHCFTPDGKGVTVRTGNGLVIEETITGRELAMIPGLLGRPMTFSPDGKLIAAAIHKPHRDSSWEVVGVRVAEVATGKEIFHMEGWVDGLDLSPDGRVLAVIDSKAIHLWDVATGQKFLHRPWPEGFVIRLGVGPSGPIAFMPDGRTLAVGMYDGTTLIWDLEPHTWPDTGIARKLGIKELEELWSDLAGDDAPKAHRAIYTLASAPAQTLPFLKDRLQPVAAIDPKQVEKLMGDLDSAQFAVRDAAAKALTNLGEQIEPVLRQRLEGELSLEMRRRVEAVVDALRAIPSGETLRTLRALRVLEQMGTPEARQILQRLGAGAPGARVTREAQEGLERLTRQPKSGV